MYPLDCEPADTISLSWQHGALAEVLCRLWKQGVDCSAINVARLAGEMSARCQGDPWALDLDRICAGLANGTFRVTDIRPAPCRTLLLEPGRGSWFLESPFSTPLSAEANGSLFLDNVPFGEHFLFELPGITSYFLYVEEQNVFMIRR